MDTWTHRAEDVPTPSDAPLHLNLWLFESYWPSSGATAVTVSSVSYTPG